MEGQFLDLPVELQNIILQDRATCLLKKICHRYYLDFFGLCEFLKMYNGIITGSCTLACFFSELVFHDIDIFILRNPQLGEGKGQKPYHYFLPVFTLENTDEIKIEKSPINDPFMREAKKVTFDYHYLFNYRNLTIDMNVFPLGIYTHMSQLQESNYDIDCCKIMFDGDKWILPYDNILNFIRTRECNITFSNIDFFTEIYDPYVLPDREDTEKICHKMENYIDYILHNIATNYATLQLEKILAGPVTWEEEQVWRNVITVFLSPKVLDNYESICQSINQTNSLLNSLIGCSFRAELIIPVLKKINKSRLGTNAEIFKSVDCLYAINILLKFLFRIVKYTLRGFHIINLSLLSKGFPSNIVEELRERENACYQRGMIIPQRKENVPLSWGDDDPGRYSCNIKW